jgi:hypothetical protein
MQFSCLSSLTGTMLHESLKARPTSNHEKSEG